MTRVGRVGDAALVAPDQAGWLISGQMLRVRLQRAPVDPFWLVSWYRSQRFREAVNGYAVGSTRQSFSTGLLLSVPMPKVHLQVQMAFRSAVVSMHYRQWSIERENVRLAVLRDALLPELLGGRLRVREAEPVIEDLA